MKNLLLLRHAQALPADNGKDIDRTLSPKGLSDANILGETLKRKDTLPDRILCSSAIRTHQTCTQVLKALQQQPHVELTKSVYDARFEDLLQMIKETDESCDTLMVIGHNPTIYEMAYKLATQGNETALSNLSEGYPPASLSVIECETQNWNGLKPENCSIRLFITPLDYNAPARPTRWT